VIFHLFPILKEFLGGKSFESDEKVKDDINGWLTGLAEEVYDESTQKSVTGYDNCLNVGDDCVEK
jgi:hypothetical protein